MYEFDHLAALTEEKRQELLGTTSIFNHKVEQKLAKMFEDKK